MTTRDNSRMWEHDESGVTLDPAPPVADPDDGFDIPGLHRLANELLDSWYTAPEDIDFGHDDGINMGRFLLIHGFAAHVHALAAVALPLLASGRTFEAMPLNRAAFETAIHAGWLAQQTDGGEAFANEFARLRRAMAQDMKRSENEDFRDSARTLPGAEADRAKLETTADAQARAFKQMCTALEGGEDLYITYRLMSEFAHPSMRVSEHYLVPNATRDGIDAISHTPEPVDPDIWLFYLVRSLVWAGAAYDTFDVSHRRATQLEQSAASIWAPVRLTLKT